MVEKIQSKSVSTTKGTLIKEMERLQQLKMDNPNWFSDAGGWARDEFGDNLDTITPLAIERNEENCQVCSRVFPLEERYMRLEFSFCDEYDCGMNICKACLVSMTEEVV